jgi:hypothetical protein
MQAARWADDIRSNDRAQNRPRWHYINLPFKPEGQPATVQVREPDPVNILTALVENESVVKNENDPERERRTCVVFHLVGRRSRCTRRSYSADYPSGDRAEIKLHPSTQAGQPMDLQVLGWVITPSQI